MEKNETMNKILKNYKSIDTLTSKPYLEGVHFIKFAMEILKSNPTAINKITKELYSTIAIYFDLAIHNVERAIRHARQYFNVPADANKNNTAFLYYLYTNEILK